MYPRVIGDRPFHSGQRILIVDDHALIRDCVRALVDAEPDMCLIGEAHSGKAALEAIRSHQPDVILMDLSMPGDNGIETTSRILERWPHMKVLALTMHEDRSYLQKVLEVGACGYLLKRSAGEQLIRAIRKVSSGETYIDPALGQLLAALLMEEQRHPRGGKAGNQPLAEREEQTLRLFAAGYTNKEIGVKLKISEKTVETYKMRAMKKLEMDSRVDVIQYALQQGWFKKREVIGAV